MITMDFVVGLQRTTKQHDAIWVIIDRLTKIAHLLALKITLTSEQLADLYAKKIVRLHGILSEQFVSKLWYGFQAVMGTKFCLRTILHHQSDGQSEKNHTRL